MTSNDSGARHFWREFAIQEGSNRVRPLNLRCFTSAWHLWLSSHCDDFVRVRNYERIRGVFGARSSFDAAALDPHSVGRCLVHGDVVRAVGLVGLVGECGLDRASG